MLQCQQILAAVRRVLQTEGLFGLFPLELQILKQLQCDTFSRSNDAVFELSTRFVEPFKHKPGMTDEQKLEAERLMFIELTQSTSEFVRYLVDKELTSRSLPLGKFD